MRGQARCPGAFGILALGLLALCAGSVYAQPELVNGGNHDGILLTGETNAWTLEADTGDYIVLRSGRTLGANSFHPWLRLYDTNGVEITDSGETSTDPARELALTAPDTGTYTVLVSDGSFNGLSGNGSYRLHYFKIPGTYVVADDGGVLTNGGAYDATIAIGDVDAWSFTVDAGDKVVLRSGRLSSTDFFHPWLRLFDTNGVMLGNSGVTSTDPARELTLTSTNGGTYTVLVADGSFNGFDGTGSYRLHYFKVPGGFVVADDGGALTNGANHDATMSIGDVDAWTFTADVGDRVVLRAGRTFGEGSFIPWLRLYDPNGEFVTGSTEISSETAAELTLVPTNGGTYTLLVADGALNGYDGTGTYRLHYFKAPGAFVVGDEGGSLVPGTTNTATILIGDLDIWSFAACQGEWISLEAESLATTNNFSLWLRLYGPDGALLESVNNQALINVDLAAPTSGSYRVLLGDGDQAGVDGTGTYQLTGDGLSDDLRLCLPEVNGATYDVDGVGGTPGATLVLSTATNLTPPVAWQSIQTNLFDPYGVINYTNAFNPAELERYFRLEEQ